MTTKKRVFSNVPKSVKLYQHKTHGYWFLKYYFGQEIVIGADGEPKKKSIETYEKLDLETYKDTSNEYERTQNRRAKKDAHAIWDERKTELRQGKYAILKDAKSKTADQGFIRYYKDQIEKEGYVKNTLQMHKTVINHLIDFAGEGLTFDDVTSEFVLEFLDYLRNDAVSKRGKVPTGTAQKYHQMFWLFVNKAHNKGFIEPLPKFRGNDNYKKVESKSKEYLTEEELQQLYNTDEPSWILRSYFLFSCATGIAFKECQNARYGDIKDYGDGRKYLQIVRSKTKEPNKIPLSKSALDIIEKRKEIDPADDYIFKGLKSSGLRYNLKLWVLRAGINKNITPHCARNTWAGIFYLKSVKTNPVQIIPTLMNVLDHKDMSTTQRYIDKTFTNIEADVSVMPEFSADLL